MDQGLPDNKIIEIVNFEITLEWQEHILIQLFDSATKIIIEIVEFWKQLDTAKEILQ